MGLTKAASRKTTNSNPSADTRVMYLLGSWIMPVLIAVAMMADAPVKRSLGHLGNSPVLAVEHLTLASVREEVNGMCRRLIAKKGKGA